MALEEAPPQPALWEGVDERTLQWHLFCHCKDRTISFCGSPLAFAEAQARATDGAEPTRAIESWDGLGEFCGLCTSLVGAKCPWGCRCGECRALDPRDTWWHFWERRRSRFTL